MDVVYPRCACLDIHMKTVVVRYRARAQREASEDDPDVRHDDDDLLALG